MTTRKRDEKMLYEIIEATGETLDGNLHIINMGKEVGDHELNGHFRVYHKTGYCFDAKKEYICEPDEYKEFEYQDTWPDGFYYSFSQTWDGFKNNLSLDDAIKLIKHNSHLHITT
jgi:hypothetical protein